MRGNLFYHLNMYERPYQKLIVWKEAYSLCLLIYSITQKFPSIEKFRLVDQMCRSASSVPTNIAEGNSRRTVKDKAHYFTMSLASLNELHCETLLARDLQYIDQVQYEDIDDRIQRVSYLLIKLRNSLFIERA